MKYQLNISDAEEAALRRWHEEDPVDQDEVVRNEEIFKIQHSRNPFIDYPQTVKMISNF
ncbi:hypothetical protein EBU94_08220 [bacterium]|nr:hypothetical protein [bacterium]